MARTTTHTIAELRLVDDCYLGIVSADNKLIKVKAPISPGNRDRDIHPYTLENARFILEYPFEINTTCSRRITVIENKTSTNNSHRFADRGGAFAFQTYITGYVPVDYCENIVCGANIRPSGLLRPLRSEPYTGKGEMQLWCPVELTADDEGGDDGSSISTARRAAPWPQPKGGATIIGCNRPPLVVFVLRDDNSKKDKGKMGTKYTMLKAEVGGLQLVSGEASGTEESELVFQRQGSSNGSGFAFQRLHAAEEINHLRDRDVCGFARNSAHTMESMESIKVMYLKIRHNSDDGGSVDPRPEDHCDLRAFGQRLKQVQDIYSARTAEGEKLRVAVLENGDTESVRSMTSNYPTYRRYYRGDRRNSVASSSYSPPISLSSGLPRVDTSAAFPRTPSVRGLLDERYELLVHSQAAPSPAPGRSSSFRSIRRPGPGPAAELPSGRPWSIFEASRPHGPASTVARSSINSASRPSTASSTSASFVSGSAMTSIGAGTYSERGDRDVFADLDGRLRRYMPSDAPLGSPEGAIRSLHALPGGPRALLYEFDAFYDTDMRRGEHDQKPFRCPFDIVYPGEQQASGSCKGPGFYSLGELWRHLKRKHESFTCHRCLQDFPNTAQIIQHTDQPGGCAMQSARLPTAMPYTRRQSVKDALVGRDDSASVPASDEERWNRMWTLLFPTAGGERPSPYYETPTTLANADLARLEMVFAALVDNDSNEAGVGAGPGSYSDKVTKTNAKRYLRVAIQAIINESLDTWEGMLAGEPRVDVSTGDPDATGRMGPAASEFLRLMGADTGTPTSRGAG